MGPYGVSTKKPAKHLTVFSPETVNIKQLANLRANTNQSRPMVNTWIK